MSIEIQLRYGRVAREICKAAKELHADLIVMRNPKRSGWRRLLSGGTAEKVMRQSACPVLCLRRRFLKKRAKCSATLTQLRPCGTAFINGKRVDVVTEGALIEQGASIKVVAVEGMRVVVREV